MKLRNLTGPLVMFSLLAVFLVARYRWTLAQPNEWGTHNLVVEAQSVSSAHGPHIGPCPVFPKDNVWNTPIDSLPKSSMSDAYIASIGADSKLHPDFASVLSIGIPYTEIGPYTPHVPITFDYRDESDLGNYPIPPNPPIEGGTNAVGDRHIILIDTARCLLYELYAARPNVDGSWHAGSGIKIDLTGNAIRPANMGSADAAGMAIFPGLVRYDEVASGEIDHALRFTTRHTQHAYVWPARHYASRDTSPNVPPMGLRLRLRADFDISHYPKDDQVILRCLKRYGMILADNGGSIFITGVSDKRWDDADLHKLGNISATDFEAVDESQWQLLRDSARVDPVAYHGH